MENSRIAESVRKGECMGSRPRKRYIDFNELLLEKKRFGSGGKQGEWCIARINDWDLCGGILDD